LSFGSFPRLGRDDGEGNKLWAVGLLIAQRRADHRAPRQRTEIQGYLPVGASGDGLPGSTYKKGILYAKEIGPLPDALFSLPQSEEQCCELDRSTARL